MKFLVLVLAVFLAAACSDDGVTGTPANGWLAPELPGIPGRFSRLI